MSERMAAILEGMLFLAGDEGLSVKEMAALTDLSDDMIAAYMSAYQKELDEDPKRGLTLVFLAGRYKLATKVIYKDYYEKMVAQKERGLSQAAMETLAIIAYRQPVTRLEIEEIRGVASDATIRRLQARGLIKEAGRQDSPGKPILYTVTDAFMDAFNLADLSELPPLSETEQPPLDLFDMADESEEEYHDF